MRGVKTILSFLLGSLYASGWWAAAMYGNLFFILPSISTLVLCIFCIAWLVYNWTER